MDRELRDLHRGARRERERVIPDPGPCEPPRADQPEQAGPPLRTEHDGVYHTVCDSPVEPDPSDMTFYCAECDTRIDPAEYHD
jgi:hypothetical protein